MLLALVGCVEEAGDVSVKFAESSYRLNVGEVLDLASELKVSNSSEKPAWMSSEPSVASVDSDGLLTAYAAGEADIKAVVEGKAATCVVYIADLVAEKISLTAPESLSSDGSWGTVKAEVEPEAFNMDNLEWIFTPSDEAVDFETEKVGSAEYRLRFNGFVESGAVTVTVKDINSELSGSVTIGVTEKTTVAKKISLTMPSELTGGGIWASVKASVEPEEYDLENLIWDFKPSSESLGFRSEKISASEYRVCFGEYVAGGSVTVIVSDGLSQVFNQGRIKVLEMPEEGLVELSVSPKVLVLNEGDGPVALSVFYTPESYDESLLEWTSSDEDVVTVERGVLAIVGTGEAVITVSDLLSDKEASCAVKVVSPVADAQIKRIDLSQVNLDMRVGEESVQLTAACYEEDGKLVGNYSGLVWSAAPMTGENGREVKVVEVSQTGIVTPINPGSTQIVVTDVNNAYATASCNVTVRGAEIKVTEVKLLPSSKVMEIGETFALTAVVSPDDAEDKVLSYQSSDETVAVVTQNGVVTGVNGGEAVISATSSNGIKGICRVTVEDETGVFLSDTRLTLSVGQEKQLSATVKPSSAGQTVTWSSSAPDVVSVENGLLKALKAGKAVITASADGMSATCEVSVEAGEVNFEITFVPSSEHIVTEGLMQDKTFRLNAFYTRADDGSEYVPVSTDWVSSDHSVATVDAEGNVTAVVEHIEKAGLENGVKVIITHTADHKSKSFELTVVKAMPEAVVITEVPSVDGVRNRMMHGDTFTFKAKVIPEKANQDVWFAGGGYMQLQNNTFTATKVGVETFIAYASDNTNARAAFDIEVLPVVMTDIRMSRTSMTLLPGGQAALTVSIVPENSSYKDITWSSSDKGVAVVDGNGVVTALSAGHTVITATQVENGLSCTCEVTVADTDVSFNVGDYYYSTGMVSSSPDEDESLYGKVIGVVFSVSDPSLMGDSRLAADHPECTHGFVVSTAEYTSALAAGRGWSWADLGKWMSDNGYTYYYNLTSASGYSNTLGYEAANAAGVSSYGAAIDVTLFNSSSPVAAHKASVAAPSATSGWYVPSYKEMQMLHDSMSVVNASLTGHGTVLGTGNYWSSTIDCDAKIIRRFDMGSGGWYESTGGETTSCPVRMILAF